VALRAPEAGRDEHPDEEGSAREEEYGSDFTVRVSESSNTTLLDRPTGTTRLSARPVGVVVPEPDAERAQPERCQHGEAMEFPLHLDA